MKVGAGLLILLCVLGMAGQKKANATDFAQSPLPPVIHTTITCEIYRIRLQAFVDQANEASLLCNQRLTIQALRADGYTQLSGPCEQYHGCTVPVSCAGVRARKYEAWEIQERGNRECHAAITENDSEPSRSLNDVMSNSTIQMATGGIAFSLYSRDIRRMIRRNIDMATRINSEILSELPAAFDDFESYTSPSPSILPTPPSIASPPPATPSQSTEWTVENARQSCGSGAVAYFQNRVGGRGHTEENFWSPNAELGTNNGWYSIQNPSWLNQLDAAADQWSRDLGYTPPLAQSLLSWTNCMHSLR